MHETRDGADENRSGRSPGLSIMSNEYDKDHIFNETSPNFRLRFQWMAGNLSDSAFDKLAKMTLEGRMSEIKCAYLIFHGEFDHLTHTQEVYRYFNALASPVADLRKPVSRGLAIL